ncbi:conserved hypothetical protein [Sporisorium reilianum SRZ2]|uniref:COQ9 domain-containing protein n=1 Tax=Sporisorium reilianum (strain SRZ2) TaxID=999809 RepID=E6ZZ46_SPORE|nr:conserved hypothetical protein [Sporisorium reilianum SRZ2]
MSAATRSLASSGRGLARTRPVRIATRASVQPARMFTSTSLQRSTTQSSSETSTSSKGRSTHPNAATQLLLDTIPAIPQYGFTKDAYLSSSTPADRLTRERIAQTLFPGLASTFDARLFAAWNNVCDLAVVHTLSPDSVLESLKSGQPVGGSESKPVRMQSSMSEDAERTALAKVAAVIEERLRLSWSVRHHLTHVSPLLSSFPLNRTSLTRSLHKQGITALCTHSPTTSYLHSIFPHATVLPNLPNPLPLLDVSSGFVSLVLTQAETGWIDPDTPQWYAVRARLTVAYTAATLHAASSSVLHFQDTQRLFQRVVKGRENGVAATAADVAGRAGEWTRWGGRGWLGVSRSLGL